MKLLILILLFQISILFINSNRASEMTGINDIINKHYKEYVERNPNIQQSNTPYEKENDPIRGHACDHDKMMQRRIERVEEYKRNQRELEQQKQQQQQEDQDQHQKD